MAKKLEIGNSRWEFVEKENKKLMKIFLDSKKDLSNKSLMQYESGLKIFFLWVEQYCENKFLINMKKRDFLRYQNFLIDHELSANGIKFKRSAVSSLCNFIETYYDDEYPTFRNIVNGVEPPVGERVYKKEPLTTEELKVLRKYLIEKEMWQHLAYLDLSYWTAGRREEIRQLRKEIATYEPNEKGFYATHDVRTKGRGRKGKIRSLYFSQEAMDSLKNWLKFRGDDDCEYIFVSKIKGKVEQVSESAFNYWCSEIFSKIVGRRVHPHLLRSSRATHLVVDDGKDINSAKKLLGHNSSQTTEIYVIRDDAESLDDCF